MANSSLVLTLHLREPFPLERLNGNLTAASLEAAGRFVQYCLAVARVPVVALLSPRAQQAPPAPQAPPRVPLAPPAQQAPRAPPQAAAARAPLPVPAPPAPQQPKRPQWLLQPRQNSQN